MASVLRDSMEIPTVRPRLVKTIPGINTLVKTVELLVASPGAGQSAEVMKSVAAAVGELKEAVEQQTFEVKQQKEAVQQQTAVLLLAPVSVSLPLSLQEVVALARREDGLARLVGQNRGVSVRMENKIVIEGATGAVEEARAIFKDFVKDSLNHRTSHEEELTVAGGSRSIDTFRSQEASASLVSEIHVLVPTNNKDCPVQLIRNYENEAQVETGGKGESGRGQEAYSPKLCRENVQLKTTEAVSGKEHDDKTLFLTALEAHYLQHNKAEKIKVIEGVTKAVISVMGSRNDIKREIVIRGSENAIDSARLKIKEALHGVKCEKLIVKHNEAKFFIANMGKIVKTFEVDTAANISFVECESKMKMEIKITGSEKAVTSAKLKIQGAISKMKHRTLLVTGVEADVLLTNKAEKIKTIEGVTATGITFERVRFGRERSLVITGSENAVGAAEMKIKRILALLDLQ